MKKYNKHGKQDIKGFTISIACFMLAFFLCTSLSIPFLSDNDVVLSDNLTTMQEMVDDTQMATEFGQYQKSQVTDPENETFLDNYYRTTVNRLEDTLFYKALRTASIVSDTGANFFEITRVFIGYFGVPESIVNAIMIVLSLLVVFMLVYFFRGIS